MNLRTIKDADLRNRTVLYRSPYDIAVDKGEVVDDSRIRVTLPTLEYLLEQNCKIVVLTYVGRPNGRVVESLRTNPHAKRLSELLDRPVDKVDDCVGEEVRSIISEMKPGDILMLENTRFHLEEKENDKSFARELARNGDVLVFDAFPQSHRVHASTTGILEIMESYSGLYIEEEIKALTGLLDSARHPFTVIIGGAKISDKVDAIRNLHRTADSILVAGGPANVFLKATGTEIGDSFVEDVFVDEKRKEKKDWVQYAREILQKDTTKKIKLPVDLVITDGDEIESVDVPSGVPRGWKHLDIGPKTSVEFAKVISDSNTIFWNGPLGRIEDPSFTEGTRAIIEAINSIDGQTVAGGGDTIAAINKLGDTKKFSHISLAGGAALELLAGVELPTLKYLS